VGFGFLSFIGQVQKFPDTILDKILFHINCFLLLSIQ
jgi:hypothetical protein